MYLKISCLFACSDIGASSSATHSQLIKFVAIVEVDELAKGGSHEPPSKIVGALRKILILYFL